MKKYSFITIIYNPNSTGDSRGKAARLRARLGEALPGVRIRLRATKRQGHAEAITYRTALLYRRALVISVSGDGGYNEVVNGAMRARRLGRKVTVGLLPAGNANDHYASRHRGDLVTRIIDADEDSADVLRIRAGKLTRYGHSYAGVGLTPQAGERLNQHRLNLWQEIKIIGEVLLHFKSVKLLVDGDVRHYDSLIFSNVGRMSKIIRLPGYGSGDDGVMEVSHLYFRNKLKLVGSMVHAAMFGLPADEQTREFSFSTLRRTAIQIDGEIIRIDAGTDVTIDVRQRELTSIV